MQMAAYIYSFMQRLLNSNGAVVGGAGVGQQPLQGVPVVAAACKVQRIGDDVPGSAAVHIGDGAADGLQCAVDRCKAIYRIIAQVRPGAVTALALDRNMKFHSHYPLSDFR